MRKTFSSFSCVGESDGDLKHSGQYLAVQVIDIYSYGNRNRTSQEER